MRIGRADSGRAPRAPKDEEGFAPERAIDEPAFTVDVEGFEGPLDLLLELARRQKVDLSRISILELADQYLAFVEAARKRRLELAADYLVMAAWLAYLKSRLLLPKPERPKAEEAPAEEMAARLAYRLAKLDAMRTAAEALRTRPQLGRDVFGRGDPEPTGGPGNDPARSRRGLQHQLPTGAEVRTRDEPGVLLAAGADRPRAADQRG